MSHYEELNQFAHGKQELRPTRLSIKDKSEAQASKSSSSTRSCTNGPRSRSGNQFQAAAESEDAVTTSQPASPVKPEPDHTLANFNHISDWSPLDDAIELELPHYGSAKHPSREEVDAYIFSILHGPTSKRRLPAFVELCSEQDIHD